MADESFSFKEVLVEMRSDLKEVKQKLDRIDRDGSIGTRAELLDHETRLRSLERWRWGLGGSLAALGTAIGSYIGLHH